MQVENAYQNSKKLRQNLPVNAQITLVGGCFDLLHVGHIHLLKYAASLGNLVIVAVLSDSYIRSYKGGVRPIISEEDRLSLLASIRFVDFAYISDISTTHPKTLKFLQPDLMVFEQSPTNDLRMNVRLKNIFNFSPKTKILFLPRYKKENISTGSIISRIQDIES